MHSPIPSPSSGTGSIINIVGPSLPSFLPPTIVSESEESSNEQRGIGVTSPSGRVLFTQPRKPQSRIVINLTGNRSSTTPVAVKMTEALENEREFKARNTNEWQKMFTKRPTTAIEPRVKPDTQAIGSKMPIRNKISIKGTPIDPKLTINAHSLNRSIQDIKIPVQKQRLNSSFSRKELNYCAKNKSIESILRSVARSNPQSASQKLLMSMRRDRPSTTQTALRGSGGLNNTTTGITRQHTMKAQTLWRFDTLSLSSDDSSLQSSDDRALRTLYQGSCKNEMASSFPHLKIVDIHHDERNYQYQAPEVADDITPNSAVNQEGETSPDRITFDEFVQTIEQEDEAELSEPQRAYESREATRLRITIPTHSSLAPVNTDGLKDEVGDLPQPLARPQTAAIGKRPTTAVSTATRPQTQQKSVGFVAAEPTAFSPFSQPVRGSKVRETSEYGVMFQRGSSRFSAAHSQFRKAGVSATSKKRLRSGQQKHKKVS